MMKSRSAVIIPASIILLFFLSLRLCDEYVLCDERGNSADVPVITVWYGNSQRFGHIGTPQKWVNVLGNVSMPEQLKTLSYSLNGAPLKGLSIGPDLHRLAMPGDFNIELDVRELRDGANTVTITAVSGSGDSITETVFVQYESGNRWPLPYTADLSALSTIEDAVQVVDGLWELQEEGIRTVHPYYDRVLAVGDTSWTDYEVTAEVIIHDFLKPHAGPPNYNVTHFGIGARWPGHHEDGFQPGRRWYPLGAATEFQLDSDLKNCRWRILADNRGKTESPSGKQITLGAKYVFKMRVEGLPGPATLYKVKMWKSGLPEPDGWELTGREGSDDVQSGCALLVAHHTDVTLCSVSVSAPE